MAAASVSDQKDGVNAAGNGTALFGSFTGGSAGSLAVGTDSKKSTAKIESKPTLKPNEPFTIPKSYPGAIRAGMEMAVRADHKTAIECFTAALVFRPTEKEVFTNRAASRFAINDLAGALQDWNIAIGSSGGEPDWYRDRGLVYGALGQLDAAIADLNRAIELEPDFVNFYVARAKLFRERARKSSGPLPTADSKQSDATGNKPPADSKPVSAPVAGATAAVTAGPASTPDDLSKAIIDYTYVLVDLREDDAYDALVGRAECYSTLGQYDRAISDLTRAETAALEGWKLPPVQLMPAVDILERRIGAVTQRIAQFDAKIASAEIATLRCQIAMDWDSVHEIRSAQPPKSSAAEQKQAEIAVSNAKAEMEKAVTAGGWAATNAVANARAARAKAGFVQPNSRTDRNSKPASPNFS